MRGSSAVEMSKESAMLLLLLVLCTLPLASKSRKSFLTSLLSTSTSYTRGSVFLKRGPYYFLAYNNLTKLGQFVVLMSSDGSCLRLGPGLARARHLEGLLELKF